MIESEIVPSSFSHAFRKYPSLTNPLINGVLFILAALLLFCIPEKEKIEKSHIPKLTFSLVKKDFSVVKEFILNYKYISIIYLGFILVMVMTFAMDAQEVVFTQKVIGLSEIDYSLLISITGIGSVTSGLLLSIFSKYVSVRNMIAYGIIMSSIGYLIYAFSWSFNFCRDRIYSIRFLCRLIKRRNKYVLSK